MSILEVKQQYYFNIDRGPFAFMVLSIKPINEYYEKKRVIGTLGENIYESDEFYCYYCVKSEIDFNRCDAIYALMYEYRPGVISEETYYNIHSVHISKEAAEQAFKNNIDANAHNSYYIAPYLRSNGFELEWGGGTYEWGQFLKKDK